MECPRRRQWMALVSSPALRVQSVSRFTGFAGTYTATQFSQREGAVWVCFAARFEAVYIRALAGRSARVFRRPERISGLGCRAWTAKGEQARAVFSTSSKRSGYLRFDGVETGFLRGHRALRRASTDSVLPTAGRLARPAARDMRHRPALDLPTYRNSFQIKILNSCPREILSVHRSNWAGLFSSRFKFLQASCIHRLTLTETGSPGFECSGSERVPY